MNSGNGTPEDRRTGVVWSRRSLIKASPLLLLAGCDMTPEGKTESFLRAFQKFNDWVQSKVFDASLLAEEYPLSAVTPEDGFRINGKDDDYPDIDMSAWTLRIGGMVSNPGSFTLDQIRALPRRVMNTRHCCVEGWSMIPRWGGTPLAEVLRMAGADLSAPYVAVESADDYTTSYDMPSALHPQTLLCTEAYDRPLTLAHGAPARIVIPTKLGYKSAKWITALTVTDKNPGGYWEDQGYDWFAGI
ncbi:MAG TPA: molybdopterin-dependent oxidoreductase [Bacteroidota bacterium]|nr:molybdopterin-dependent oxidoreductase [Bacteroidota bacterium]